MPPGAPEAAVAEEDEVDEEEDDDDDEEDDEDEDEDEEDDGGAEAKEREASSMVSKATGWRGEVGHVTLQPVAAVDARTSFARRRRRARGPRQGVERGESEGRARKLRGGAGVHASECLRAARAKAARRQTRSPCPSRSRTPCTRPMSLVSHTSPRSLAASPAGESLCLHGRLGRLALRLRLALHHFEKLVALRIPVDLRRRGLGRRSLLLNSDRWGWCGACRQSWHGTCS